MTSLPMVVRGKNTEVSDALRSYVQKKVGKLGRITDGVIDTVVEIAEEKTKSQVDRYVVQVTMEVAGTILRGEERAADARAAVDAVVDVMERQLERYKGKLYRNRQKSGQPRIAQVMAMDETADADAEERDEDAGALPIPFTGKVVKRKRFVVKMMSYEEAAEQMELLDHDFFFFLNEATGRYNVIYRRHDGDYGLIEPEA